MSSAAASEVARRSTRQGAGSDRRSLGVDGLGARLSPRYPPPDMEDPVTPVAAPLRLDSTGQHLGGPMVGPHDNAKPVDAVVRRCVAQLTLVVGR